MRLATLAIALNEERFIKPHLKHIPSGIDKVVLRSLKPWQGQIEELDGTDKVAEHHGAEVISDYWKTEEEQRNYGQQVLQHYDWIISLDPDEFVVEWDDLIKFLETAKDDAYVCEEQFTYWKRGYIIDPPEDHKQIIALRPHVKYTDKRVIDRAFGTAPVKVHHFSWARTDQEVKRKIETYAHAHELIDGWLEKVWHSDQLENLHPLTPESLKKAMRVRLPKELEGLDIWP